MSREGTSRGTAWITGASSGIGRASALALAKRGFAIAATARREEPLEQLVAEITEHGGTALAVPTDITDPAEQSAAIDRVRTAFGPISTAVLAAGTNTPQRFWGELEMPRFREIVDTNLNSIAETVHRLIPGMQELRTGQFILISSWAAWRHSPGAGVAYAASKTALGALAETINAQLGGDGIRACHLCPGDVDTDFLNQRPSNVTEAQRSRMLSPQAVARAVGFVADSPPEVCVNEVVITPTVNAAYGTV